MSNTLRMNRNLAVLFILCHILTLSLSDSIIEEPDDNSDRTELKDANLNHRKLPIFPKNTKKFVVSVSPPTNIVYSHKPKNKMMPTFNIITPMMLKPKVKPFATTLARKEPPMKLRTFTMKPHRNEKFYEIKKYTRAVAHDFNKPKAGIGINKKKELQTEAGDPDTEMYLPEESQINVNLQGFNERVDKAQPNKRSQESGRKNDKLFLEDEQDRSEFIFSENGDQQQIIDMLNIGQELDEDIETNTEFEVTKIPERVKRSKNIIEEENLASTVSGLKYTGRDTRLNNNFYFKNINS